MSKNKYADLYKVDVTYTSADSRPKDTLFQQGMIDKSEVDTLFPVDPVTGNRSDIVSQIVDPNTGDLKRNQLMSVLDRNTESKHRSVDDDTLLSLLKSRYTQSQVENDNFAKYVETIINESKSSEPVKTVDDNKSAADTAASSVTTDANASQS